MELSLIAVVSDNGIFGSGLDIPWQAKGEQLLFRALTYDLSLKLELYISNLAKSLINVQALFKPFQGRLRALTRQSFKVI